MYIDPKPSKIVYRKANLHNQPKKRYDNNDHYHVTVGDIHGNALKLIYTLIEEGILGLSSQEDYQSLRDIYAKKADELTETDINLWNIIVNKATINSEKSLYLLGDELADRGSNDWFTLTILKKLSEANFNIQINLSNHSMWFIEDYESLSPFEVTNNKPRRIKNSLNSLKVLISKGIVSSEEVKNIVENHYIPTINAIGYTVLGNTISIYTHAPIGLETIESLASKYDVKYDDKTIDLLIQTINGINNKISAELKNKTMCSNMEESKNKSSREPISTKCPVKRLVWNRNFGQELRTKPKGNFRVNFIHGHNGNLQLHPSTHTNLDNQLGKTKTINKEHDYFTRTSRELTAKKYVKSIKNLKTYKYKCKKSFSFFSVNANTFNGIDKKYEKLEGSNLKLHILLDFEKNFKKEKKSDSRNKLINLFKKSDEYRVLKKSRGIMTQLFKKKTSSIKLFEEIVRETHLKKSV